LRHPECPEEDIMAIPEQIELKIEQVSIDDVKIDDANPRNMPAGEMEALVRSIGDFGMVDPLIVRREDRIIIHGNQRAVAARKKGYDTVPVIWLDIDRDRAHLLGVAMNKISGTFDQDLLATLLTDINTALPAVDLTVTGFMEEDVNRLLRSVQAREKRERPENFDFADALEKARTASRTESGDTWILGEHRLHCGDSTDPAVLEDLLGGDKPDMAFTDPPYGVGYRRKGGRGSRPIANDDLEPEQWVEFTGKWVDLIVENVQGAIYVCMSAKEMPLVSLAMEERKCQWSSTIVWAKNQHSLGRGDYQNQHELIWYGRVKSRKRHWGGGRTETDVWNMARVPVAKLHPTMKPLELVERAILNSSRDGDIVLDPFAGSGTTIIACERTDRRCVAVELDPVHVDAAVARWEAFTGLEAAKA
jgi:DNA modification methylase